MMPILLVGALASLARDTREEDVLARMLTLHQRSLVSDRPLPSMGETELTIPEEGAQCTASSGAHVSSWAARFARSQVDEMVPRSRSAVEFDSTFRSVSLHLNAGRFTSARARLYELCIKTGMDAAEREQLLTSWASDCGTMLQYMPRDEDPPVREDHKRLHMLLHDLGGSLLLFGLLGELQEAMVSVKTMGELAGFIKDFGEVNRKTALTRALAAAAASDMGAAEAAAMLRSHGHCIATPLDQADLWSRVGVPACATVLLRGGWEADALAMLKDKEGRVAVSMATSEVLQVIHNYILFAGRYDIDRGPPVYRSATCVLVHTTLSSSSSPVSHCHARVETRVEKI